MSDLPDVAKAMLNKRIAKQKELKERKILEVKLLQPNEWLTKIKPLWNKHFNAEKVKHYEARQPFYDEHGACIMLLMTKPFEPKISENKLYYNDFEYLLMCDDEKDHRKFVRVFDNKNKSFESWYYKNGKALTRIGFVRGDLKVKFRDLGDTTTWGILEDAYCKAKNINDISELTIGTYERLFQLNVWEICEILNPGVD